MRAGFRRMAARCGFMPRVRANTESGPRSPELSRKRLRARSGAPAGFQEPRRPIEARAVRLLRDIKKQGHRVYGISAPSRASTLIQYVGLDDGILDCVLEINGSLKIGKYMPGTLIPVLEESRLFEDQPEYALLLAWHIADELMPKLREKGYRGKYIIPLPAPRIVESSSVRTSA